MDVAGVSHVWFALAGLLFEPAYDFLVGCVGYLLCGGLVLCEFVDVLFFYGAEPGEVVV